MLPIMGKLHFKVRICEHLEMSALTGKRVKGDDDSSVKENLLIYSNAPDFEDFSILTTSSFVLRAVLLSHGIYFKLILILLHKILLGSIW